MFESSAITVKEYKPQSEVISHGDVHHLNILWHKNKPYLIDWEISCIIDATYECFLTAMRFGAGHPKGGKRNIDMEKVCGFLNEYSKLRRIETERLEIALHVI